MIPVETPQDVTESIGLLRMLAGLTQRQLATAAEATQTEIALWEAGKRMPGPARLLRVLRALGHRLAIVPLDESGPETALSAHVSAEHAPGVDGEGLGGSNGRTGHTGGEA